MTKTPALSILKPPKPAQFYVRSGDSIVHVNGWESNWSLGIAPYYDPEGLRFASILLLAGVRLVDGFDSIVSAHRFNDLASHHPRILVGTPFQQEVVDRAGGALQLHGILNRLKQEAITGKKSKSL